ncbi:MAG: hypothetical protein GY754_23260 [bacterium]|nr:hypothetical protein [bacterium]
MYKTKKFIIFSCFFLFLAISCERTDTNKVYKPVYLSYEELRSSIRLETAGKLSDTGKIYIKDHFIYINEKNKGIHIINNENPSQPVNTGFINIPGNMDIAIRDSILYADSFIDLVAIDISNPNEISVSKRIKDAFPYRYYDDFKNDIFDDDYHSRFEPVDKSRGIVIDWEVKETESNFANEGCYSASYEEYTNDFAFNDSSTGTGGSMARFTIIGDYLYSIDRSSMQLFTISDPSSPSLWSTVQIGWDIETIFSYQNKLFIGSQTGMYIFDNSDPSNPVQVSEFSHARSCDPVVASGNYAYVTLRSGTRCRGGSNQLDIINISNLENPELIKSYSMQNPYGLAMDNDLLFICDGDAGLKIFDASDPMDLNLITHFPDIKTYDVILNKINSRNIAIVIGPGRLYQYDFSDPNTITLLSSFNFE